MAKPNTTSDPMSNRPDYIKTNKIDMPVEDSVRFPRLKLIQALSPEVTRGHEKFVSDPTDPKGYKPLLSAGELILQSDTGMRVIDGEEGITVIPLAIRKRYVEYVKRDAGGGFVASYDTKEAMEANFDPANDIQTTIEFLVIEASLSQDEVTPFTITFDTVSKLGTAKRWAQSISQYETLEGVKYLVTGKPTVNKKKQSYYNFEVKPVGWVDQKTLTYVTDIINTTTPLFLPAETNSEI